jgi:hypothetical protein
MIDYNVLLTVGIFHESQFFKESLNKKPTLIYHN